MSPSLYYVYSESHVSEHTGCHITVVFWSTLHSSSFDGENRVYEDKFEDLGTNYACITYLFLYFDGVEDVVGVVCRHYLYEDCHRCPEVRIRVTRGIFFLPVFVFGSMFSPFYPFRETLTSSTWSWYSTSISYSDRVLVPFGTDKLTTEF